MKVPIFITFVLFITAFSTAYILPRKYGSMSRAWYEHGQDVPIPNPIHSPPGIYLVVNIDCTATNFISCTESNSREWSSTRDTVSLMWNVSNWEKLTSAEKTVKLQELKKRESERADIEHTKNNKNQQQVWIFNNSLSDIKVQMHDCSFVCILEGKSKESKWEPIQYWLLSNCGNSYYSMKIKAGESNSFITTLPNWGKFETMLRFKLLGMDTFYYSNEFKGKVNQSDFREPKPDKYELPEDRYLLEHVANLAPRLK